MKIVMFTNTFTPHVGGVARSVSGLSEGLLELGHDVLVVAPVFPGASEDEEHVIRIPAVQKFGGSDFSLPIPVTRSLAQVLDSFAPDIVHSHHPFLLGGTALRVAAARKLPIVYTYHTNYELYNHYVATYSEITRRLALNLALGYCDLCDAVIAPSASTATFVSEHTSTAQTVVIPTGVEESQFENIDSANLREDFGIPKDAFVVGHVGRLAVEKNLEYLANSLVHFLDANSEAHVLIAGGGAVADHMQDIFAKAGLSDRSHFTGVVIGEQLAKVYLAMDVFAFSSLSETQGLVLTEAMSAGVPVVALDAPGAREVVDDGKNGRLLPTDASTEKFAEALNWIAGLGSTDVKNMRSNVLETSKHYSRSSTIQNTLSLYKSLIGNMPASTEIETSAWKATKRSLAEEWKILGSVAHAVGDAVMTLGA